MFGGTSGAGPHVAGTLALLMQAANGLSAIQVIQAMYDGAVQTPDMGLLPNKDWGYGKLDVHKAALGATAGKNTRPIARGEALDAGGFLAALDGATSSDPEGDPLTYRWDWDYDGIWDTPQGGDSQSSLQLEGPAQGIAKLRVYDDKGAFSEVLVPWEVREASAQPEADADVTGDTVHADVVTPGDSLLSDGSGGGGSSGGSGGCGVGPTATGWWLLLGMVVLAWLRFRRSARL